MTNLLQIVVTITNCVFYYKLWENNNFESHNSLKLSFTNIREVFVWISWMWIFPWIKLSWDSCSIWGKLGLIHWSWQFVREDLSSCNLKGFGYSYAWICSLCEGRTSFFVGLISKNLCRFLILFSTSFTLFSVLLLFPLSITFFVLRHGFWYCFI